MKRLLIKLLIFLVPIIIFIMYNACQNLCTPATKYTFRVWEALLVFENNIFLKGPFYPNMEATMLEEGDIAHGPEWGVLKNATWYTDKYGYRKKDNGKLPEVVIIGDSFTVGTGLTQSATITEVLQNKTGLEVYPYAPKTFNDYLQEERFKKNPPKIVILESIEKLALSSPNVIESPNKKGLNELMSQIQTNDLINKMAIANDRLKKSNFTNSLIAKIDNIFINYIVLEAQKFKSQFVPKKPSPSVTTVQAPPQEASSKTMSKRDLITPEMSKEEVISLTGLNVSRDGTMVFSAQSEEYFAKVSNRDIKDLAERLISYRERLKKDGIEFIYFPIPNKENIYYDNVRDGVGQDFLQRLIAVLKQNGVRVIDTQSAFEKARNTNPKQLLYFPDDAHWSPLGVDIAAELLKEEIVH